MYFKLNQEDIMLSLRQFDFRANNSALIFVNQIIYNLLRRREPMFAWWSSNVLGALRYPPSEVEKRLEIGVWSCWCAHLDFKLQVSTVV